MSSTKKERGASLKTPTKRRGHPQTNPASLANLAPPFPKGVSGNPGGRPKLLGEAYKDKLKRLVENDAQGRTYAELIADAAVVAALKGDVSAMREIRAATEIEMQKSEVLLTVRDVEQVRAERWKQFAPALAAALHDDGEMTSAEGAGDE